MYRTHQDIIDHAKQLLCPSCDQQLQYEAPYLCQNCLAVYEAEIVDKSSHKEFIDWVNLRVVPRWLCASCDQEFRSKDPSYLCPECQPAKVQK